MNKCPRCESEILKEEYKYCPLCGEILYDEIKDTAIEMLKALLLNYKNYECEDTEEEEYKMALLGSLSIAISALERTAQEVPSKSSKYREKIEEICQNRLIGFNSLEEDAQLIEKVVEIFEKENLSISRVQGILEDVIKIIPMIVFI